MLDPGLSKGSCRKLHVLGFAITGLMIRANDRNGPIQNALHQGCAVGGTAQGRVYFEIRSKSFDILLGGSQVMGCHAATKTKTLGQGLTNLFNGFGAGNFGKMKMGGAVEITQQRQISIDGHGLGYHRPSRQAPLHRMHALVNLGSSAQ